MCVIALAEVPNPPRSVGSVRVSVVVHIEEVLAVVAERRLMLYHAVLQVL